VAVGLGSETAGVDFQIQPGGLVVVRGVVVDDRGQPARGAQVALLSLSSGSVSSVAVHQDGSFVFQGQDVSDTGLRIAGTEEIDDVQLVITRRTTSMAGSVVDAEDRPAGDYTVIAFADDRARWRPHSRYFAVARPGPERRFAIDNLPPGEYLVAAVDWVEEGTEEDPALLESLRAAAARVLLGDGEHHTLTLRLTIPRQ